jgi:cytosine/adenosine deaminase-related metal-dependent hydrolase
MAHRRIHADHAWSGNGFASDVMFDVEDGRIVGAGATSGVADLSARYVLPGMPNLHSHAFQRAMAGLAERQSQSDDSFWTWREVMYAFARSINPDDLRAIAAQLYVEMLKAGYTQVCEFHYLHHQPDGRAYADPAAMSLALIEAAREAGIGITLLPTLYMTGGFDGRPLSERQRRFGFEVDSYLRLLERVIALESPLVRVGIALHSLRAVPEAAMRELLESALVRDRPIHIHVAEQIGEVQDCFAIRNARPVDWLLDHAPVDARWCLVHATHLSDAEMSRLAASGAIAGLCPTTEANLGDGLFPLKPYLDVGRRGVALARIRPAPRDAATQRQRIARIARYRGDAVPPRARRRRAGIVNAGCDADCRSARGFRRARRRIAAPRRPRCVECDRYMDLRRQCESRSLRRRRRRDRRRRIPASRRGSHREALQRDRAKAREIQLIRIAAASIRSQADASALTMT